MRIIRMSLVLAALLSTQTVFADDEEMMPSKSCTKVANACVEAGFARKENEKKFWIGCMKPLLLGKAVEGVTLNADTIKTCRTDKIETMKKEIAELEKAAAK